MTERSQNNVENNNNLEIDNQNIENPQNIIRENENPHPVNNRRIALRCSIKKWIVEKNLYTQKTNYFVLYFCIQEFLFVSILSILYIGDLTNYEFLLLPMFLNFIVEIIQ